MSAVTCRACCRVDGCLQPVKTRGWCNRHYLRWWKHGDPLTIGERPAATPFWELVDRSAGPSACWPWLASCHDGYGYVNRQEFHPENRCHRIAYRLAVGPIPAGLHVLHRCIGNRKCCNPRHLYLGTNTENVRDRDAQERRQPPTGTLNGRAKLSEDDVADIRERYAAGETVSALARHFGVARATVKAAAVGRTWRLAARKAAGKPVASRQEATA